MPPSARETLTPVDEDLGPEPGAAEFQRCSRPAAFGQRHFAAVPKAAVVFPRGVRGDSRHLGGAVVAAVVARLPAAVEADGRGLCVERQNAAEQ